MRYISEQHQDLAAVAERHANAYASASPFPHATFKNFFNHKVLEGVLSEFPDLRTKDAVHFDNPRERKLAGRGEDLFGIETRRFMHFLNSQPFLEFLQILTRIREPLIGDPYFNGGGLHEIKPGGLLKIHADFNKHSALALDRRINVLIYLNKDWQEEYGGHFELWDREMKACRKRVLPEFNTMAIFSTTDFSYHGHPDPLRCPEGRSRKSLALYYYSNGRPAEEVNAGLEKHGTLFRARAGHANDLRYGGYDRLKMSARQLIKDFVPPIVMKAFKAARR